ncbi:2-heptaprenyl-1,4-naphthoquinone methyltransferase [Labilithrix luteola]|uniref:2-heptaprenyl-1,4-naphthoquinone methyltransferase n=1 Tax=Labilithrix luteola TaxID=1391654 RepID=A0A0K1Q4R4_9BACT|nr:class I SAM-dependent methyltransferase [Labilithrix luteola]AKV00390.1 2-heptaprenyl-1,4-naphthoquinone methyltransferase [Labilithrix luteola]
MSVDIAKLYDGIATDYDRDAYGLLRAGRDAGLAQVRSSVESHPGMNVVDLGAGTGESLVTLGKTFPGASLAGIDLSAEMLAIAEKKIAFRSIVSDAAKVADHFEPQTVDLALMHFITTFVDVPGTVRACHQILRPGGYLSIVSTTLEAFRKLLNEVGLKLASMDELMKANPVPTGADALTNILREAGFEIVAVENVVRPVSFPSPLETMDFGVKSGFFTHIIEALGADRIMSSALALESAFPIADEYRAAAILARRPR